MHREMIDLSTLAGLHKHHHELHAYCARCDRWVCLDLARLIREGKGGLRVPFRVSCQACGSNGRVQVRPPQPAHRAPSWTEPPG